MSVRTTADEHLDSAAEHIRAAIKDLTEIVIEECWGHDEFTAEYQTTVSEVFDELRKLKGRLNR